MSINDMQRTHEMGLCVTNEKGVKFLVRLSIQDLGKAISF